MTTALPISIPGATPPHVPESTSTPNSVSSSILIKDDPLCSKISAILNGKIKEAEKALYSHSRESTEVIQTSSPVEQAITFLNDNDVKSEINELDLYVSNIKADFDQLLRQFEQNLYISYEVPSPSNRRRHVPFNPPSIPIRINKDPYNNHRTNPRGRISSNPERYKPVGPSIREEEIRGRSLSRATDRSSRHLKVPESHHRFRGSSLPHMHVENEGGSSHRRRDLRRDLSVASYRSLDVRHKGGQRRDPSVDSVRSTFSVHSTYSLSILKEFSENGETSDLEIRIRTELNNLDNYVQSYKTKSTEENKEKLLISLQILKGLRADLIEAIQRQNKIENKDDLLDSAATLVV